MADDAYAPLGTDPAAAGPSPFTSPSVQVEPTPTNPEAMASTAQRFLDQHQAAIDQRTKEVDNLFSKQQLTVDNMSKILDDTAASLKKQRDPANRSNLALMALGAGMMQSKGNFGTQIGAGVQNMIPAIEHDRADDQDFQFKMAQLAMRRAGIENAPLEQKLQYMRALQTGDLAAQRSIETMLIRAQGQTGKQANQQDQNDIKANYNAMQAAQKQVDSLGKDYFSTPEEREKAWAERYSTLARSLGVSEEKIKQAIASRASTAFNPTAVKGGFNTPGSKPEDEAQASKLGLPSKPTGYVYDQFTNPGDKLKAYQGEKTQFDKENKPIATDAAKAVQELSGQEQAEALLKANPNITGPTGIIPNTLPFVGGLNVTNAAQSLNSIFSNNTIHSVPQGQGAISDYERTLFNKANPSMEHNTQTNLDLIAQRKRLLNDQIQKQAFINTYFQHYKTISGANNAWAAYAKSPEGRAYSIDEKSGRLIDNPNRVTWQEWMPKHTQDIPGHARGGQFKRGGQYANGGAIHLGDEWDD